MLFSLLRSKPIVFSERGSPVMSYLELGAAAASEMGTAASSVPQTATAITSGEGDCNPLPSSKGHSLTMGLLDY